MTDAQTKRWGNYWDKQSKSYDKSMRFFDRRLFGDSRDWVCRQAVGEVLEIAIGTGLNLEHYLPEAKLTGIELSPEMLKLARQRSADLHREIDLREGDAHQLDFPDNSFDTVVCTFSLCAIPDHERAVSEMRRVLRPGGLLLLADHIESPNLIGRGIQRMMELASVPLGGEHFRRRPLTIVQAEGFMIEQRERFGMGIVERLAARKPT